MKTFARAQAFSQKKEKRHKKQLLLFTFALFLSSLLLAFSSSNKKGLLDPTSPLWNKAPAKEIQLSPQTITQPQGGSPKTISVQAIIQGQEIAFRLVWSDSQPDLTNTINTAPDGVAIMFPSSTAPLPSPFMGDPEHPVYIWQWRADWQFKKAQEEEIAKNFPAYADWYPPHEKLLFNQIARHPQGNLAALEYQAQGFGTLTPSGQSHVQAQAFYNSQKKKWAVVFLRALKVPNEKDIVFQSKKKLYFNVAVWDGAKKERGARKAVSFSWQEIQPKVL